MRFPFFCQRMFLSLFLPSRALRLCARCILFRVNVKKGTERWRSVCRRFNVRRRHAKQRVAKSRPYQFELASLLLFFLMTATALGAFGAWGFILALIVGAFIAWARRDPQVGPPRKQIAVGALIVISVAVGLMEQSTVERPIVKVSDWLAPLLFVISAAVMLFRPQRRHMEEQEK
jgi:hypothetical protein